MCLVLKFHSLSMCVFVSHKKRKKKVAYIWRAASKHRMTSHFLSFFFNFIFHCHLEKKFFKGKKMREFLCNNTEKKRQLAAYSIKRYFSAQYRKLTLQNRSID